MLNKTICGSLEVKEVIKDKDEIAEIEGMIITSNGNVGIGTKEVVKNNNEIAEINNNVGIGTTTPSAKIEIK